jgi:putrescine aminotransferase
MTDDEIRSTYDAHAPPWFARALKDLGSPVAIATHGATIRNSEERELIDFASGGLGYCHPAVVARVARQFRELPLSSRMFLSRPLSLFVQSIAGLTPGELTVTYPCNSSAEAVDGAIKLARGYHRKRRRIVASVGAYHGATLGALSVCGIEALRGPMRQFPVQAAFMQYNDLDVLEEAIDEQTAAVIIEPIATSGGLRIPRDGYLRALRARCTAAGALLIVDETNTGLGRTGEMFSVDHEQVTPDIMVLGGALGGGVMPIAAYVTTRKINHRVYGRREPTLHASTTGGNPSACVAALAALDVIREEQLVGRAREAGKLILEAFRKYKDIFGDQLVEYCGRGLLAGLRLRDVKTAAAVQRRAAESGVMVRVDTLIDEGWVGIRPPLIINLTELESGLKALELALTDVLAPRATRLQAYA